MLLEGMLWQDLNISLPLHLGSDCCLWHPLPKQAFNKNSMWLRRDDDQPKRPQLDTQTPFCLLTSPNCRAHTDIPCSCVACKPHLFRIIFPFIHRCPKFYHEIVQIIYIKRFIRRRGGSFLQRFSFKKKKKRVPRCLYGNEKERYFRIMKL